MACSTPPVLITSSVRVSAPFTKLTDERERVFYTLEAIERWLAISPGLRIVLCDGSNFDFVPFTSQKFPGASIECLRFENSSGLIRQYGKGYGEGEIVRYALANSACLADADFFAKCTAKFWVDNFAQCLAGWNGTFRCTANFLNFEDPQQLEFVSANTDFYLVGTSYYLDHFLLAYLDVRDRDEHYLEHCFRDVIVTRRLAGVLFDVYPLVFGVSGSERVRVFIEDTAAAQREYAAKLAQVRASPKYGLL